MKLNLPRYTYSEVGRIANNFLKEHHPSLEIPIVKKFLKATDIFTPNLIVAAVASRRQI